MKLTYLHKHITDTEGNPDIAFCSFVSEEFEGTGVGVAIPTRTLLRLRERNKNNVYPLIKSKHNFPLTVVVQEQFPDVANSFENKYLFLVNRQKEWQNSSYQTVEICLKHLSDFLLDDEGEPRKSDKLFQNGCKGIYIQKPFDNLSWATIEGYIEEIFGNWDIEITICTQKGENV